MREAIEELLADYAEAIDDGALERWPAFFTEDGEYQIITRESHDAGLPIGILYCDSRGMMEDRVHALRTANIYEPQPIATCSAVRASSDRAMASRCGRISACSASRRTATR